MEILENIISDPRYNDNEKITLLRRLTVIGNPIYKQILSAEFLKKEPSQQGYMYNSLPRLKEIGITLEDIVSLLMSYNNLEQENLENKISETINAIIEKQKNGRWDEYFASGVDENLKKPNVWAHCVFTRALIKWDNIIGRNPKIEKAIKAALSHIEDEDFIVKESDAIGWTNTKDKKEIKIYDTSFAITTIINFQTSYTKGFFEIPNVDTLLHPDFYNKGEGYWMSGKGEAKDTGATAHALISLMFCSKSKYNEQIEKGIKWLIENQNTNGGWSQVGKENSYSKVDRTCYVLQALQKFYDKEKNSAIERGVKYLEGQIRLTYKDKPKRYWSWLDDDSFQPDIPNSSRAISTLLRCDVPYDNFAIENGMAGLFIMLEDKPQLPSLYFICSLIDYLKVRYLPKMVLKDTFL